jgi:antitoxin ChpS
MPVTNLRKVGGSVMLAVPPAFLHQLDLKAGATVSLEVEEGRLVIHPRPRPRYTMAELLAASDYSDTTTAEEQAWSNGPAVGDELL